MTKIMKRNLFDTYICIKLDFKKFWEDKDSDIGQFGYVL